MASGYEEYIWKYLKSKIGNECGVAGLMGNLQAESGLYPNRVQGDVPYSSYSVEYTAQVDNGSISREEFIYSGPNGGGYGLAQWTWSTRKARLYDKWKSGGYASIGSIELACDFLWWELSNSYPSVLRVLKTATSVREASNKVLHDFESPADQSERVEEVRASLGMNHYNNFSGTGGSPEVPEPSEPQPEYGNWIPQKRKMSLLLMHLATKR